MKGHLTSWRIIWLVGTVVVLAGVVLGTFAFTTIQSTFATAPGSRFSVHPLFRNAGKPSAERRFSCQQQTAATRCYSPQQIRTAYTIQTILNAGYTGKGRTIVIVDAYQAPAIRDDLKLFDTTFGLNNPRFNIYAPDGLTPFDPRNAEQVGWSGEISLDVEWAHAIAPDATIDLVLAKSSDDKDIFSATKYAINKNLGDVISMSFGEGERCMKPEILKAQHQLFIQATLKRITLLASSGDVGAAQATCDNKSYSLAVSTPASDPFVTAVGGTQLLADANTGAYLREFGWNEHVYGSASGGGFSILYKKPLYQHNVSGIGKARGVPDVAYNAAINGGVLAAWAEGASPGTFFIFGGTSAGSPQWAGLVALTNQIAGKRVGFLNPMIYHIGKNAKYERFFTDILDGNNTFTGQDSTGKNVTIKGYMNTRGWDAVTGWGSPIAKELLPRLAHVEINIDNSTAAV